MVRGGLVKRIRQDAGHCGQVVLSVDTFHSLA